MELLVTKTTAAGVDTLTLNQNYTCSGPANGIPAGTALSVRRITVWDNAYTKYNYNTTVFNY